MLGNGLVNGMYNPAMVWCSDRSAHCDGINDHIEITNFGNLSADQRTGFSVKGSISFWVYPDNAGTSNLLQANFSNSKYMTVRYDDDNEEVVFMATADDGDPETGASIAMSFTSSAYQESMTHIVIAWDGLSSNSMNIYVNGTLSGETSNFPEWSECTINSMVFGSNGSAAFFAGEISDIAIFSDRLNEPSVAPIYNNGVPRNEQFQRKILLYWTLAESDWADDQNQNSTPVLNQAAPSVVTPITYEGAQNKSKQT